MTEQLPTEAMNQCDGCRRGLPLVNGRHEGPGGFWAGDTQMCTADRYTKCPECKGIDAHFAGCSRSSAGARVEPEGRAMSVPSILRGIVADGHANLSAGIITEAANILSDMDLLLGRLAECFDEKETEFADIRLMRDRIAATDSRERRDATADASARYSSPRSSPGASEQRPGSNPPPPAGPKPAPPPNPPSGAPGERDIASAKAYLRDAMHCISLVNDGKGDFQTAAAKYKIEEALRYLTNADRERAAPAGPREKAALSGEPSVEPWLIIRRGYYYRPGRCGYTSNVDEAGRYTEAEAKKEAAIDPSIMLAVSLASVTKTQKCQASQASDPPRDCDAPFCGCNPEWHKVMSWLQEAGWKSPEELKSPGEPRADYALLYRMASAVASEEGPDDADQKEARRWMADTFWRDEQARSSSTKDE